MLIIGANIPEVQPIEKIKNLLLLRFKIVHQVGILKKKHQKAFHDNGRWEEVLKTRKEIGEENGLEAVFIENIWNTLHTKAKIIEENSKGEINIKGLIRDCENHNIQIKEKEDDLSTENRELLITFFRECLNTVDNELIEALGILHKPPLDKEISKISSIVDLILGDFPNDFTETFVK